MTNDLHQMAAVGDVAGAFEGATADNALGQARNAFDGAEACIFFIYYLSLLYLVVEFGGRQLIEAFEGMSAFGVIVAALFAYAGATHASRAALHQKDKESEEQRRRDLAFIGRRLARVQPRAKKS